MLGVIVLPFFFAYSWLSSALIPDTHLAALAMDRAPRSVPAGPGQLHALECS